MAWHPNVTEQAFPPTLSASAGRLFWMQVFMDCIVETTNMMASTSSNYLVRTWKEVSFILYLKPQVNFLVDEFFNTFQQGYSFPLIWVEFFMKML